MPNNAWEWLLTPTPKKATSNLPTVKYKSPYSAAVVSEAGGGQQANSLAPGDGGGGGIAPGNPGLPNPLLTDDEYRQQFYQLYGRWPFPEEIERRIVIYPVKRKGGGGSNQNDKQPTPNAPSGTSYDLPEAPGEVEFDGGGGGDSGGGEEAPVPESIGTLAWWENADSVQPLIRNWAGWLKETIESNRATTSIANPFVFDQEAEDIEAQKYPTGVPGFKSGRDVLRTLQNRLGVTFDEKDDLTTKWQKFINKIPSIRHDDIDTQQMLAGLRYDSNSNQWYGVDVAQLVNPKYL